MGHKQNTWSSKVPDATAFSRAGGRRRYNSLRKMSSALRRIEIQKLMNEYGWARGSQTRVAQVLGISPGTVSRHVKAIIGDLELSSY